VFGDALEKRLNYAVGVFNGATDGGNINTRADANNQKVFTARLFATPFINDSDSSLRGLGLGLAATKGNLASAQLPSYSTPGIANSFFAYKSGTTANGEQDRWSPQAYYYKGPLGLIYEYAWVTQPIKSGNSTSTAKNTAWQLAGSWLLTGEDASFRGVRPFSRFQSGAEGGWGAFEVVARYQENQIDEAIPSAFVSSSPSYALKASGIAVGLNWYLNESSKFAVNYERTRLTGGNLDGKSENFLVARYQLSF